MNMFVSILIVVCVLLILLLYVCDTDNFIYYMGLLTLSFLLSYTNNTKDYSNIRIDNTRVNINNSESNLKHMLNGGTPHKLYDNLKVGGGNAERKMINCNFIVFRDEDLVKSLTSSKKYIVMSGSIFKKRGSYIFNLSSSIIWWWVYGQKIYPSYNIRIYIDADSIVKALPEEEQKYDIEWNDIFDRIKKEPRNIELWFFRDCTWGSDKPNDRHSYGTILRFHPIEDTTVDISICRNIEWLGSPEDNRVLNNWINDQDSDFLYITESNNYKFRHQHPKQDRIICRYDTSDGQTICDKFDFDPDQHMVIAAMFGVKGTWKNFFENSETFLKNKKINGFVYGTDELLLLSAIKDPSFKRHNDDNYLTYINPNKRVTQLIEGRYLLNGNTPAADTYDIIEDVSNQSIFIYKFVLGYFRDLLYMIPEYRKKMSQFISNAYDNFMYSYCNVGIVNKTKNSSTGEIQILCNIRGALSSVPGGNYMSDEAIADIDITKFKSYPDFEHYYNEEKTISNEYFWIRAPPQIYNVSVDFVINAIKDITETLDVDKLKHVNDKLSRHNLGILNGKPYTVCFPDVQYYLEKKFVGINNYIPGKITSDNVFKDENDFDTEFMGRINEWIYVLYNSIYVGTTFYPGFPLKLDYFEIERDTPIFKKVKESYESNKFTGNLTKRRQFRL